MQDALAQARQVAAGETSPSDLLEAAERLNSQLNAIIHPLYEEARAVAERPLPDGPFRGVPLLVKDFSCYMEGVPICEGLRPLRDAGYRADHDMWITRRLREAGF